MEPRVNYGKVLPGSLYGLYEIDRGIWIYPPCLAPDQMHYLARWWRQQPTNMHKPAVIVLAATALT
jgi:hypothetical protein